MTLRALLPAIHARPTGGNLYNRRILSLLRVKREVFRAGMTLAPGTWLIDSLVAREAAPLFVDGVRPILIAHYLHVLDPARRDSRDAARERKLLPRFAGVVTTSDYSRDMLHAEGVENAITIAPGLDDRYRAPVVAAPHTPARLLTVASLLPGKALLEFVDVLESLADLSWTWDLAGDATLDPAYAARVARRIARSKIRERIRLRPPLPPARLVALYDRSDLFVLPTRFETCSMVTREAMARGLAVVAYDVGGVGANLPRASAPFLAPAGDEAQLAAQLRTGINDVRLRSRLGAANRLAAMRFSTWEESAERLRAWILR
ncbi:MAG TPA: glycosyltransferase family 4 protein [Thermoanaerobaculia bacterium]|nr:glycosyltransferase family 4 protein [Thermoanaerobaculia bacterium]